MVALSGCATLKPDERALLLEHNVSPETFDRMRYNEPLTVPDIIELSKRGHSHPIGDKDYGMVVVQNLKCRF